MKINWKRTIIVYAAIILIAILFTTFILPSDTKPEEKSLSDVISMSQEEKIKSIVISDNLLTVTDDNDKKYIAYKESNVSIYEIEGFVLDGVEVTVESGGIDWGSLLISFLPLLIFGLLIFFLFSQAKGANNQAMNFGRSKARMFSANTRR
jgi:cell division protease FtsH